MGFAEARAGLVEVCQTISGLHAYDVWPATLTPPAAVVVLSDWQYAPSFDGGLDATFLVVIAIQLGSFAEAQRVTDAYLEPTGAQSIPAAIRADPTLGGRVQVADVIGGTRYDAGDVNEIPYALPAIQVEVKC